MFSFDIPPSFTISQNKITRGQILFESPMTSDVKKTIIPTITTTTTPPKSFFTTIQNYHKSWKRKRRRQILMTKESPPLPPPPPFLISTALYKYTKKIEDPNLEKKRLLVYIDLISEFISEIGINDDLTTYKVLTNSKKVIISNLLLFTCPVCLEVKSIYFIQSCGHCLCKGCLEGLIATAGQKKDTCIVCRQNNNESYWMLPTFWRAGNVIDPLRG